jgi:hypothetical protein
VTSAPPLPDVNRPSVSSIDKINNSPAPNDTTEPKDTPEKIPPPLRQPKWERKFLPRSVIAALNKQGTSLFLQIELETTDTAERKSVQALVDCGATGSFIDRDFMRNNQINTRKLSQPIAVYNVDGSPNEAGEISEVINIILCYRNHSERSLLAVTGLGRQKLLLGYMWLKEHNPEIDWKTREVKMSRCPGKCEECGVEAKAETRARRLQARTIRAFTLSPFPVLVEDKEEDEVDTPAELPVEGGLEEGDRVFAVQICVAEEV